eukprot:gnl/Chilomastix_cuspidata/4169.p6 GENE.gnl/Chilomastix_cuspidata/4169~~gnl/Chilomastix_cuspidata/4169.p6  ORF type:complete len:131 (-),score=62.15 gnl/Chilomastix_cuspidata/4169:45-437(-)
MEGEAPAGPRASAPDPRHLATVPVEALLRAEEFDRVFPVRRRDAIRAELQTVFPEQIIAKWPNKPTVPPVAPTSKPLLDAKIPALIIPTMVVQSQRFGLSCKFFREGRCSRADICTFYHAGAGRRARRAE